MPNPHTTAAAPAGRCQITAPPQVRRDALDLLTAHRTANPDRPMPLVDWQCVRGEHDQGDPHAAMPYGTAGPTIRFDAPPTLLPDRAAELLNRPGTTAVRVDHGDELLLLMPDADTDLADQAARTLAAAYPTVSFLVLAGITGAVVMPRGCPPACAEGHTYTGRCELRVQWADATRADAAPAAAATPPGPPLPEVDERLVDRLRAAGDHWGPTGVARVAARLAGGRLVDADQAEQGDTAAGR